MWMLNPHGAAQMEGQIPTKVALLFTQHIQYCLIPHKLFGDMMTAFSTQCWTAFLGCAICLVWKAPHHTHNSWYSWEREKRNICQRETFYFWFKLQNKVLYDFALLHWRLGLYNHPDVDFLLSTYISLSLWVEKTSQKTLSLFSKRIKFNAGSVLIMA